MYLNTKETLDRVTKTSSSHPSECATRTPKTKYQKGGICKRNGLVMGLTFTAVALMVGAVQYKEDRTNISFDINNVGVNLEQKVESIKNSREKLTAANIDKLDQIIARNTYVANDMVDSMTLVGARVTAASYVKVSPNHMVNVDGLDENGDVTPELNDNGELADGVKEVATQIVEDVPQTVPGPLLEIDKTDENYNGQIVEITGQNRANLESLIFNEAGNQGFIGTCLVAQVIRDQMVDSGIRDAYTIKRKFGYEAAINGKTNSDAQQAVSYIFDHGGIAVKHRIYYFYAPAATKSKWHETQNFIVQYKGHRVFDKR